MQKKVKKKVQAGKILIFVIYKKYGTMHICQVINARLPVAQYGGTERVVWSLARALTQMGHRVTFLARNGSVCDFARVVALDPARRFTEQIPVDADIAHFHEGSGVYSEQALTEAGVPIVTTVHGNLSGTIGENAVFVSRNHAERHGAQAHVHNGLDWDDYAQPLLDDRSRRDRFHFLAKAAWRVKNVRGAIAMMRAMPGERLAVLGGTRLNLKMGFRCTCWPLPPRLRFHGMVGQEEKAEVMGRSRGLLFPVRWHEPFGLAVIESLWYGAPVFATPYGALPELVADAGSEAVGFLSASAAKLCERMKAWGDYSPHTCHEYARDAFNSRIMAERYLLCYEKVLNGRTLNRGRSEARNTGEMLPFELDF